MVVLENDKKVNNSVLPAVSVGGNTVRSCGSTSWLMYYTVDHRIAESYECGHSELSARGVNVIIY